MQTLNFGAPTRAQLRLICVSLWDWEFCDSCNSDKRCIAKICAGQRLNRLTPFFQHYKTLVSLYEPQLETGQTATVRCHEELAELFKLLRLYPDIDRGAMCHRIAQIKRPRSLSRRDIDTVLNLAVRIMLMVNCSAESIPSGLLEQGPDQVQWRNSWSLSDFVGSTLEMRDDPVFGEKARDAPSDVMRHITARKLKKRARINFVPTSDIRCHLRYDYRNHTVEIYHHVAFLKEQLRLTKGQSGSQSTADNLRLGALPRQLALEVIDSIQQVLFPLTDPKSFSMLRSLISKQSMDPECLRFDSTAIRNEDETKTSYLYFGSRVADLHEELQNPRPQGVFEKWLERKSGARYVMLATLIGVAIAILLGAASLAVSVYQAYIQYQAWQHPVTTS